MTRDPRILLQAGDVVFVDGKEDKVRTAGIAGFTTEAHPHTLHPWHERPARWTAPRLDRQDRERTRFSNAANCGRKE